MTAIFWRSADLILHLISDQVPPFQKSALVTYVNSPAMFNQFVPNVKAIITFLKLLKIQVNDSTVNDTLQNHPDWPGVLCITDSLNKWNIPNGVGKVAPNQIDQLPVPFIAFTNKRDQGISIITDVDNDSIQRYSKNYNRVQTESKENFLKEWTGIYLLAETTEHSGEKEYASHKRAAFFGSMIPASLALLLVTLSAIFLYDSITLNKPAFSIAGIWLQFIVLLMGILVALMLLWYEVDQNNPLLKKVCTGIAKGNCSAILTGRQSKVFSWLSWSEVGFFYFTGGVFVLLFSGLFLNQAITLIALFNMLALPYPVFSIYYQWRVAKQWCILCLSVQALLLLGAINIFANGLIDFPFPFSIPFLLNAGMLYLLPVLLWFTIKPTILDVQLSKNTKRQYLQVKFSSDVFQSLLNKQKAIPVAADGLGISLGNPNATHTIIKVCNPYCGPCAKAHPKLEKLLEENANLKVQVIFAVPNNPDQAAYKPVTHLLAIQEKNSDKKIIKKALDDWYLSDKKEYEPFAAKYPMNGELTRQGDKIAAMEKWCREMDIQHTPTIFFNRHELPDAYSIEDLQYFLAE